MHPKLERALPLLEHLAGGGKICCETGRYFYPTDFSFIDVIDHPERYTIHREPRVVFANIYKNGNLFLHGRPVINPPQPQPAQ